jgi:uncharacterized membrane protein YciS (DUF1049 family)
VIRTVYLTVVLVFAALAAAVFAWLNPGDITLDVAFAEVTIPIAFAFATAIGIGWLLGWISVAVIMARMQTDHFFLRRKLRRAERDGPSRGAARLPGGE